MYAEWYGGEHSAPELQKEAVYGLTELARDEVLLRRVVKHLWWGHSTPKSYHRSRVHA